MKLKDNFFDEEDIKLIQDMPNGKDYIIFFLKLQLKSVKTEGLLKYKNVIPYTPEMLATVTDTNVDIVKSAIKLFEELKLIEVWDDGTIYMNAVQDLIGNECESAERVRRHRAKKLLAEKEKEQKALHGNNDETKCNTEIESEKEIDIKKDYSLEIKNFRQRYDLEILKLIDEYILILKTTRVSNKIADSVICKVYEYMSKFPITVIKYACSTVINNPALHSKKENYFYGILRNTKADEAENKLNYKKEQQEQSQYRDLTDYEP